MNKESITDKNNISTRMDLINNMSANELKSELATIEMLILDGIANNEDIKFMIDIKIRLDDIGIHNLDYEDYFTKEYVHRMARKTK